ncbi:uncharacterized protein SPSK_04813 [Sporothrix schenckii 1099-18]|uniref:Galactose oxidase n=2 Tax=Sporothrix schenckii TaxID=29908 RepID=U7Q5U8_SPOS1|nr:uncharacterized protein SPSK_04813 [Sporothrix schenckii 1099-18]ERT02552.1 hypothetical protein HMPREF1624_00852 [Sporothrix schenckii ATCC 58251]KJR80159.1 hypothetical protein SPSK_04813 [Sporothrix schenckii 1099-18]
MAAALDGRLTGLLHGRRQPMAVAPQAVILATLVQLLPRVAAESSSSSSPAVFPYTPTSILVPSANSSVVYLFSASASGQVEFLSLNISSTLSSYSSSGIETLTAGVPFLVNNGQENTLTTFTPAIRSDGSIFVYAGDCSSTSSDSATVWTYNPSSSTAQWTSSSIPLTSSQSGPWFLGSSTGFSNQVAPVMSNSTFYLYGGMCPTTGTASSSADVSSNWQSSASYSNKMLKLVPSGDSYTPSFVSSKGPPIAEAGFTFTKLPASQSNRSGIVTQQVNSVVLGGHTETAFVNMSTAAIWSLPEEAWSFVSIANPSSAAPGNSELTVVRKDGTPSTAAAPDSRSGHSAVLSEDGNSLIILGGWVGDVTQAADPQLAVLKMGPDYGQWQWSIPSTQPSGSGMYGHGAALLPGNVMVVYGGYNISSSSTSPANLIRRGSPSDGNGLMFYNLTSLSWSENYTYPTKDSSAAAPSSTTSHTSSSKIALGLGLGLGIPLAILLLVLLVHICRRRSRQRHRRDEAVRALAQDHQQFLHGHDEMVEKNGGNVPFGWGNGREGMGFYTGGHDPYVGRRSLGFESLRRTKPSPAFPTYQSPNLHADDRSVPGAAFSNGRTPARNVARGLYQPTTINDYESFLALGNNGGAAAGNSTNGIHPIYEADEEDDDNGTDKGKQRAGAQTADSTGRSISPETEELIDPFLTPSTQSVHAGSNNPMRSSYAGALGPNTVNLNPFVRNTPSPDRAMYGGAVLGVMDPSGAGAGPSKTGQDRDVQEWVTGLEIEDLLFSPPAHGAGAAIAASISPAPGQTQPRGRVSPSNTSRRISLRSKHSSGGSPTRSSFLGSAAAAAAGAVAGVTGAWGSGEDEARTGSNLSDKSAFSFLSRTTSSRGNVPHSGVPGVLNTKVSNSDSSSASFNTAQTGFRSLRNEGPELLYGKGHQNGSSAGGSFDNGGGSLNNNSGRAGASTPTTYTLNAPPVLPPLGFGTGSHEYSGAAGVLASGAAVGGAVGGAYQHLHASEDDDNEAPPGSPSKLKGRRTWMGSIMRIFSSGSAANANLHSDLPFDAANSSSVGTGAQQGPNYRDMAHATLLRRKQGRSDWEADELREEENTAVGALRSGGRTASMGSMAGYSHSIGQGSGSGAGGPSASGNITAGRRDGSGKSDEWDVEKAVQNRVVQVMFTMPRAEQLRVVNAEVEREEDEADIGSVSQSVDPHDYSINTDLNHDDVVDDDDNAGGLSAPPPPPVLQRPYQSYRSRSPLETTSTSKASADESYRALPPSHHLASPIPPEVIDQQDEQLRQLHEALAESKRLLSTKAIEPWMLDAHDDDYDDYEDDAVTSDEEEVHEDEAQAVSVDRGKVVDVGWMDAGNMPSPLNTSSASEKRNRIAGERSKAAEERETLATAAALARVLMNRPGTGSAPTTAPAKVSAPASSVATIPTMPARPAAAVAPPASPTRSPAIPTTPVKPLTPVRSLGSTYKTPTKAISDDSLSSKASLASRRSGRRGTLGGDTLLGSPAATEAASTIKKPAGFVLDMVDKIELTGSPKSGHSRLDA